MRFKPNRRFAEELERDPHVRRIAEDRATEALGAARAIAAGFRNTGAYERSLFAEGPALASNDPAAWLIEFGSANNPVYAPLRRAAEQVGAKVVDRG